MGARGALPQQLCASLIVLLPKKPPIERLLCFTGVVQIALARNSGMADHQPGEAAVGLESLLAIPSHVLEYSRSAAMGPATICRLAELPPRSPCMLQFMKLPRRPH